MNTITMVSIAKVAYLNGGQTVNVEAKTAQISLQQAKDLIERTFDVSFEGMTRKSVSFTSTVMNGTMELHFESENPSDIWSIGEYFLVSSRGYCSDDRSKAIRRMYYPETMGART